MGQPEFDVDEFLSQPLNARVATGGPTVRPTWFLWEDHSFWILTGPWARLPSLVGAAPAVALVVDECDLVSGLVRQVIARGDAEILPFDVPRGRRLLSRYLGADEARWDPRFRQYLHGDTVPGDTVPGDTVPGDTVWVRLQPSSLSAADLSYAV